MRGTPLAVRVAVPLAAVALVALLPQVMSDFRSFQFVYVGFYFIAVLGLVLVTGFSGQVSLGHGAFMAIGAYTTAIFWTEWGVNEYATIPLAGLVAGVVGFLFGFPALRLSGVYLALATFALAVSVPSVAKRFESVTGGSGGLILELPSTPFGLPMSSSDWLYYVTWAIALVLFAGAWTLLHGRFGRALRAIRDGEIAAVASGVNIALYKTLAFGISAFYAGIAGSLLAVAIAYVNPDTFPLSLSILLLTGAVVGGLASLWGAIAGALFIEFVPIYAADILDFVQRPFPGELDPLATGASAVVYGVILVLVMFLAPHGVAGLLRRLANLLTNQIFTRQPSVAAQLGTSQRRGS